MFDFKIIKTVEIILKTYCWLSLSELGCKR